MLSRFLFAAPKRRTTHSKKAMRASNKAIKNIEHSHCPVCGFALQPHCICRNCFESYKIKMRS